MIKEGVMNDGGRRDGRHGKSSQTGPRLGDPGSVVTVRWEWGVLSTLRWEGRVLGAQADSPQEVAR